jgi:glycosyltransferase involved in cell wall biosynthesis
MRLSVCIPAYQAERYVREAIESVLADVPDGAEIILVDDGSTDATHAVAASYEPRIRILRQAHGGIGAAFNTAVAASSGDVIAAIDADDLWLAGKTEAQLRRLAAEPQVDVVFGHAYEFVSPDVPTEMRARWRYRETPAPGILRGAMMIRRSAWDRVGAMDTDLHVGEFVAWYARAVDAGLRMSVLSQVVLARRIHGANTVLNAWESHGDYLQVVWAVLERRRGGSGGRSVGSSGQGTARAITSPGE